MRCTISDRIRCRHGRAAINEPGVGLGEGGAGGNGGQHIASSEDTPGGDDGDLAIDEPTNWRTLAAARCATGAPLSPPDSFAFVERSAAGRSRVVFVAAMASTRCFNATATTSFNSPSVRSGEILSTSGRRWRLLRSLRTADENRLQRVRPLMRPQSRRVRR